MLEVSRSDDEYFSGGRLHRIIASSPNKIEIFDYPSPLKGLPRLLVRKTVRRVSEWGELEAMEALAGESFVVKLYHSMQLPPDNVVMFMEYCACESLKVNLERGNVWSKGVVKRIVVSLLQELQRIHARDIVHRDIKPANIFITANFTAKFGDFGSAKHLLKSRNLTSEDRTTSSYNCRRLGGNLRTLAGVELHNALKKRDEWSLGKTLLEFISGRTELQLVEATATQIRKTVSDLLTREWPEYVPVVASMLQVESPQTLPSLLEMLGESSLRQSSTPSMQASCFSKERTLRLIEDVYSSSIPRSPPYLQHSPSICSEEASPIRTVQPPPPLFPKFHPQACSQDALETLNALLRSSKQLDQSTAIPLLKQLFEIRRRNFKSEFRVVAL